MYRSAAYTVPTASTVVPWDTVTFDAYGMANVGVGAGFSVPVAGMYMVYGQLFVTATAAAQYARARIYRGNNTAIVTDTFVYSQSAANTAVTTKATVPCVAADIVSLQSLAPVALALVPGATGSFFEIDYLGTG
jgi:hypothetical protein